MNNRKLKKEDQWTPFSWQSKPLSQPILYPDWLQVEEVYEGLSRLPPLVDCHEIEALKEELTHVPSGDKFILIAGECVEMFEWAHHTRTQGSIEQLTTLTQALEQELGKPVIPIGRLGGVYSKPRTEQWQWENGQLVANYQGDLINGLSMLDRTPDPRRMIQGYAASRLILTHVKQTIPSLYSAHELLHLSYEQAFIRESYNQSAHLHWVGERTRYVGGAHVEMARGLLNPKAVKIGPGCMPDELAELLKVLEGAMVVFRLGLKWVKDLLPSLLESVPWDTPILLDPMHGNTKISLGGQKVRLIQDIVGEIEETLIILRKSGRFLNGLFLETTIEGEGGCQDVFAEGKLTKAICDPGLTSAQALKIIKALS